MEDKINRDRLDAVEYIKNHPKSVYITRVMDSNTKPYMFLTRSDIAQDFSEEHAKAFKDLENWVLDRGWDSSGYANMMQLIKSSFEEKL